VLKKDDNMKNNSNRKTNKSPETQTPVLLREQIETRAYQIWIAGGRGHGSDLQHWLQAETEILKASQRTPPDSNQ
jgi:Protein of unknown function (DUF2934)